MTSRSISSTSRFVSSSSGAGEGAGGSGGISYTPITRQRQSGVYRAGGSGGGGVGGGLGGGYGGGSSIGGATTRTVSISYGSKASGGYGNIDALAEAGVKTITVAREKEKKDMQDLNSRFANYIEKNRFLEAQLKAVEQKLKELQAKWGKETAAVKQMYETELKEVRDLYNGAENDKAKVEMKVQGLEDQLADLKRKLEEADKARLQDRDTINLQNQQLSEYEAELNMLRRRVGGLESDLERESKEKARLQDELFKTIQERDAERLNSIELDNRAQSLIEEIEFLKQLHDQELKELQALANQDNYAHNRKFWESEMSNAIRDLQQEFDRRVEQHTAQQESYYQMKVQEVRTSQAKDNSRVDRLTEDNRRLQTNITDLRNQLGDIELRNNLLEKQYNELLRQHEDDLRNWDDQRNRYEADIARLTAECEKLLREVEAIMDMKLSLELEIAAYRKLLEGEETRLLLADALPEASSARGLGSMLRQSSSSGAQEPVQQKAAAPSQQQQQTPPTASEVGAAILRGEMSQKTSFTRSAKGPVAIAQCDPAGAWVEIENTGRKTELIENWQISRKVDNKNLPLFTFPKDFSLGTAKENKTARVYAKGKAPTDNYPLEFSEASFGLGSNIVTQLLNDQSEVKADHIQKTVYA